jgi:ammonia channel protein AmtB
MGVRVNSATEDIGLDMEEHGNNAYPSFAGVKASS